MSARYYAPATGRFVSQDLTGGRPAEWGGRLCRIRWPGRGERAICRLFRQAAAAALPPAQSRNSAASADAGIPAARGAADGPSVPNPGTDRRGASDQHTAVGVTQNFPLDVGGNDINKTGRRGHFLPPFLHYS